MEFKLEMWHRLIKRKKEGGTESIHSMENRAAEWGYEGYDRSKILYSSAHYCFQQQVYLRKIEDKLAIINTASV